MSLVSVLTFVRVVRARVLVRARLVSLPVLACIEPRVMWDTISAPIKHGVLTCSCLDTVSLGPARLNGVLISRNPTGHTGCFPLRSSRFLGDFPFRCFLLVGFLGHDVTSESGSLLVSFSSAASRSRCSSLTPSLLLNHE